jgi:hypothetical protein
MLQYMMEIEVFFFLSRSLISETSRLGPLERPRVTTYRIKILTKLSLAPVEGS